MKICLRCNLEKPLDSFYKAGKNQDKVKNNCKDCCKDLSKEWRAKNLARHNDAKKNWSNNNREKCREYSTRYNKANPQVLAKGASKYRAKKKQATPAWASTEFELFAISEIYDLAMIRTRTTGIEHQVDHIVPLSSPIVQGLHCTSNLQIIVAKNNKVKGNRFWPDMPGRNE